MTISLQKDLLEELSNRKEVEHLIGSSCGSKIEKPKYSSVQSGNQVVIIWLIITLNIICLAIIKEWDLFIYMKETGHQLLCKGVTEFSHSASPEDRHLLMDRPKHSAPCSLRIMPPQSLTHQWHQNHQKKHIALQQTELCMEWTYLILLQNSLLILAI